MILSIYFSGVMLSSSKDFEMFYTESRNFPFMKYSPTYEVFAVFVGDIFIVLKYSKGIIYYSVFLLPWKIK